MSEDEKKLLEEQNRNLDRIASALEGIAAIFHAVEPIVGPLVNEALKELNSESAQ